MSELFRGNTAYTMASNAWSTSELVAGLEHILTDAKNELPDDMAQLEDLPDTFSFIAVLCFKSIYVSIL